MSSEMEVLGRWKALTKLADEAGLKLSIGGLGITIRDENLSLVAKSIDEAKGIIRGAGSERYRFATDPPESECDCEMNEQLTNMETPR